MSQPLPIPGVDDDLRVLFVGWGAMAQAAAGLLGDSRINIVGIAVRNPDIERVRWPPGAELVRDPEGVADLEPDVVAEAAGRDAVDPWGRAGLNAGADLIVSSVSALADEKLLADLVALADRNGVQLTVHPGALGGIDALAAARLMGIDWVEHRIVKPPEAWRGTPAEDLCDLDQVDGPTVFFEGSAAETSAKFPRNANVAMTTALAGIGPLRTRIILIADSTVSSNSHELRAAGPFGELAATTKNAPLAANPKTSAMAGLSLARSLQRRTEPIVV